MTIPNVGDHIKAYPMMVGGEIVTKFGPTKQGKVIKVIPPANYPPVLSKYHIIIIEKQDGSREGISIRQLAEV